MWLYHIYLCHEYFKQGRKNNSLKKPSKVILENFVVKFRWHFKMLNLSIKDFPQFFKWVFLFYLTASDLKKNTRALLTCDHNKPQWSFECNEFLNGGFSITFFTDCFLFWEGRWNLTEEAEVTEHWWWLWLPWRGVLRNRWCLLAVEEKPFVWGYEKAPPSFAVECK